MMKHHFTEARPTAFHLAWLVALAVLAVTVTWAYRITPAVALVDGWAVLNRIMHFQRGDITLVEYLFHPHGAHLHSIIYAISWLDFRYMGGAQILTQWISLLATALFGIFFVRLILREGARYDASRPLLVMGCAAAMAAICSLADLEIMMHPFQAVLTVSRLTYILLLYAIIVGMIEERFGLYAAAMLLSLLAVTFHGTGYVFALCVIGSHVLVCRRLWMAVVSTAPLLSIFIVQSMFLNNSGEMSHLGEALNMRSLVGILPAMGAYFAAPLASLEVNNGTTPLLCIGFVIFCTVTFLTVRAILAILGLNSWTEPNFWQQMCAARTGPRADPVQVFLAVIGAFLLASGVAATLFWVIRTAGDPRQLPPSYFVLLSGRYGAFACLGFVIVVMALLRTPYLRRAAPVTLYKAGGMLATAGLLCLAGYASLVELRVYDEDDRLHFAAAAILTGISPIKPEADSVWIGAGADPYWAQELPATVKFMRVEHKGLWYRMPRMGARGGAFYAGYSIANLLRTPVASDAATGRCAITGTIPANTEFGKAGRILPLANADGVVVGYGALLRLNPTSKVRAIRGFALCPSSEAATAPLFLAHDMRAKAALTANDEPESIRGSGALSVMPLSDMKGALSCVIEAGVAGEGPDAVLTLTNETNFEWIMNAGRLPIGVGVHLKDGKGEYVYWDAGLRVAASGVVVAPSDSVVMRMPIASISLKNTGPDRGPLSAHFELVQDGHAWFNNISCSVVVRP